MQISSLISALTSSAASGQTAASQMGSGTSFQADPAAGQQLPTPRHPHQNHALTSNLPLQLFDMEPTSGSAPTGGVGVGASAYGAAEAQAASAFS